MNERLEVISNNLLAVVGVGLVDRRIVHRKKLAEALGERSVAQLPHSVEERWCLLGVIVITVIAVIVIAVIAVIVIALVAVIVIAVVAVIVIAVVAAVLAVTVIIMFTMVLRTTALFCESSRIFFGDIITANDISGEQDDDKDY
jgi:hypothetical protein